MPATVSRDPRPFGFLFLNFEFSDVADSVNFKLCSLLIELF